MMERLEALKGNFWTDLEELVADIEAKGFWIEDSNEEYITAYTDEDEDYEATEWVINLVVAGGTIAIKSIEEIQ